MQQVIRLLRIKKQEAENIIHNSLSMTPQRIKDLEGLIKAKEMEIVKKKEELEAWKVTLEEVNKALDVLEKASYYETN